MENSLKLKQWIASNKTNCFKIKKLVWHKKFDLTIHDYMVEVHIDEKIYIGRGTDKDKDEDEDEDTAICKSFAEAFERYCVKKLKLPNTNGCAAHFDADICKSKALNELIERDCFLYKYMKMKLLI